MNEGDLEKGDGANKQPRAIVAVGHAVAGSDAPLAVRESLPDPAACATITS
jgi:hypothetical protein